MQSLGGLLRWVALIMSSFSHCVDGYVTSAVRGASENCAVCIAPVQLVQPSGLYILRTKICKYFWLRFWLVHIMKKSSWPVYWAASGHAERQRAREITRWARLAYLGRITMPCPCICGSIDRMLLLIIY